MSYLPFRLPAIIGGTHTEVACRYDTKQPWSFMFTLLTPGPGGLRCEQYHVDRALIGKGFIGPAGTEGVRISPSTYAIEVRFLTSRGGDLHTTVVHFDRAWLFKALTRSYQLVPTGSERKYMDWDAGLRASGGAA